MNSMNYKIEIQRSFRKTLSLKVEKNIVIVKAPYLVIKSKIDNFILKNRDWIDKRIEQFLESKDTFTKDLEEYKKEARKYIPDRVKLLALKFSKNYNTIKITSAKTRWWSCTSRKNLNFSYRLILLPKETIDYVIIHELAHLKYMNHSKSFWQEVEKMMPEYRIHDNYLREFSYKYNIY